MPERPARAAVLAPLLDASVPGFGAREELAYINLRGPADDARFVDAVRGVTGVEPPRMPNTRKLGTGTERKLGTGPTFPQENWGLSPLFATPDSADALQLAWLGPDEWLLSLPATAQPSLLAALNDALAQFHFAVTDLGDAYAVLVLDCADAAEILAADCPLDFHPRAFAVGACAQSLVGKANALIVREGEQRFALYLRRSFAPYAHALLRHAAVLARAAREISREAVGVGT